MSHRELLPSPRTARVIGLLRPLKDVTVTAGETATFDCELSYEDIPVEWYLRGKKLEPSDKVRGRWVVALPALLSPSVLSSWHACSCSALSFCYLASPSLSFPYSSMISVDVVKWVLLIFVGFNLMIFLLKWKLNFKYDQVLGFCRKGKH